MKKLLLFVALLASVAIFSISATAALGELPETTLYGYVYKCDTCDTKWASQEKLETPNDCPYSNCDGQRYEHGMCSKEYFYAFKCSNCNKEKSYYELPQSTADAPYGVCEKCGTAATEDMFKIDFEYMQYSVPCFYCYKVQLSPYSIDEYNDCPYCNNPYNTPLPDSVDDNGNLIYGGGGSNLYYCPETDKFYEAIENEETDETDNSCPYCSEHSPKKINIVYCTDCPSCGAKTSRIYLDCYKLPYYASTIKNAFAYIASDIVGNIDPNDFDITNRCYECGYKFYEDTSLIITRYVDAPDDAVYERYENDGDYHETEKYAERGSEYDSFFEKLIWIIKKYIRYIKNLMDELL